MRKKSQFIKDIRDKDPVASTFMVKFAGTQMGKTGKLYMNVVLVDKTGELESRIWEDIAKHSGQVVRDALVWVEGRCQSFQGRRQLVINQCEILREDEVDLKDYIAPGTLDAEALYQKLLGFVDSMKDPFYRALAEAIIKDDSEIAEKIKIAPAAKTLHHAYKTGLLEHIVSITELLDGISKHYGNFLDRDLLFLGGFLHDIGKLWELTYDRAFDYTTEGRLIGHLVMGVELVEKKVQWLEAQPGRLTSPFPEEKKLLVKHVILAHHGQLDYGSPKRPKLLEALIVHMIDDLDSKVNSIRVFTEQDQNPGQWTGLNKQYGRFFFKPEWMMEDRASREISAGE